MLRPDYPVRTERLLLRPFEKTDFDDVFSYRQLPEVHRFLYSDAGTRGDVEESLARWMAQDEIVEDGQSLALAVVFEGRVVGEADLKLLSAEHGQGEIGYILSPAVQGRGFATEAARPLLDFGLVQHYIQVQPVYDLTVEGVHTYHVVVGDSPILLHNCGEPSDELLDLADANIGKTNVASEVTSAGGLKGYGVSGHRNVNQLTPDVRSAVEETGHHGGCGEVGGLCDNERQGGSIWNARSESVDVMGGSETYGPERHGAPRAMCPSCQKLFKYLNIS